MRFSVSKSFHNDTPTSGHRTLKIASAFIMLVASMVSVAVATPTKAEAHDGPIEIHGRGWGHRRGMGQYGAYGYASDYGWSSEQILSHYYGNTTAAQIPASAVIDPTKLRVELRFARGRAAAVGVANGSLEVTAGSNTTNYSEGAVRINAVTSSSYTISTAKDCAGPWTVKTTVSASTIRVRKAAGPAQDKLLQVCGPDYRTWYDGEITTNHWAGLQHTMNTVSVEQYLRGVIPNEMPASWPKAALEAQSVAARSYVMAGDTRWKPYADTCDTTLCQVYDGRYTTRGGVFRKSTHENTDSALEATKNLVRLYSDGRVARTEFSSSTGGQTVGIDFPAVQDLGDAITKNPNHQWQKTLTFGYLERKYGLGHTQEVKVVKRDGVGIDGGRVLEVQYRFSRGTKTVSGATAKSELGLKSDLFTVGPSSEAAEAAPPQPAKPTPTPVTSETAKADRAFIINAYQAALRREPTAGELVRWQPNETERVDRAKLANVLTGTKKFVTPSVKRLYRQVHRRNPDSSGQAHWVGQVRRGADFDQVVAAFYGSEEYFASRRNNNRFYVTSLYRKVLRQEPDPAGLKHWVNQLESGKLSRADLALSFYRTPQSRDFRARYMYKRITGQNPSAAKRAELVKSLANLDDVELGTELVKQLPSS